jgi:molecular chaperone DnaK (HSP70)
MPRTLVETTAIYKRYQVTNAQGKVIGQDIEPILTGADANAQDLQNKARNAIQTNNTFLGLANPTTAQVTTQVQNLTKENTALIKLMLGLLDDTAGT